MLKYVFTELFDGGDGDKEEIKVDSEAPRDRKKEYHDKIIGPILINCIHLFTFVFNDLPQKLSEYIENGVMSKVVEYVSTHEIPLEEHIFVIFFKFFSMLALD
jgi:hypothetical protein